MSKTPVLVEGRTLNLSNLDKVFYPEPGFTKGQVIDYYTRIAPVLLPYLKGRAFTLKRYPDGVEGQFFYEKQCPKHRPEWMKIAPVWSERKNKDIEYCVINDLPSLIWAVNLGSLELHTTLGLGRSIQKPTMMVFDLDPGQPATIIECLEVAEKIRDVFEELDMRTFAKTSGSKGLQLYVPLNTPIKYERTKPFALAVAESLERWRPDLVVSSMKKQIREGKVLIDWSQNDDHKTTVCAYSLRAKSKPTVSTPLTWKEIAAARKKGDPDLLSFGPDQVLKRVKRSGDLSKDVLTMKQKLPDPSGLPRL